VKQLNEVGPVDRRIVGDGDADIITMTRHMHNVIIAIGSG
jgi:hypothetical protein